MSLIPLQNSWTVDQLEKELRDLFVQMYQEHVQSQADEVNVYGAPHLGDLNLIARHVMQDGLALMNDSDETKMRYIFKAFRYRNPERGLHMLRTYARVLFGNANDVKQLWQKKDDPYPLGTKNLEQLQADGESESDYFLTSRARIDLDADGFVPERIVKSLRTVLPARLLLELRISKYAENTLGFATIAGMTTVLDAVGTAGRYTQFYNGAWTWNGEEDHDGILHGSGSTVSPSAVLTLDEYDAVLT